MKHCTRCLIPKPDACFLDSEYAYLHGRKPNAYGRRQGWCSQCRLPGEKIKGPSVPPRAPFVPPQSSSRLRETARRERRAYAARGSRVIARIYTHIGGSRVLDTIAEVS